MMKGFRLNRMGWIAVYAALGLILALVWMPPVTQAEGGAVQCYVELANIQGDPGDPTQDADAAANYELYETASGSAPQYLKTKELGRRFAHLIGTKQADDGSTVAYYARGRFTYIFDVFSEMGEMTIMGVTYKGGEAEQYRVSGKYEEQIVIPDLENGLMPVNTSAVMPDAYCAGWAMDERTGDKTLMTYSRTVTEHMLPTEDMPYEGLEFKLTGTWFNGQDKCVLTTWYDQLPEEADAEGLNRMNYNGKVYVNYPQTNYEMHIPKGSKPSASNAPGLTHVAVIEPDSSKPYPEGDTWSFLYDRQGFTLSFETNGAPGIAAKQNVKYHHSLSEYDPGWTLETVVNGRQFTGWYIDGEYVADSLTVLYMTPNDLTLEARWA